MHGRYRTGCGGWELVVGARKLGVIAVLVLARGSGGLGTVQAVLCLVIVQGALLLHLRALPLELSAANRLETLGLVSSAGTIMGGLACAAARAEGRGGLGSREREAVQAGALLLIGAGYVAVALDVLWAWCLASATAARAIWRRRRARKVQVAAAAAQEEDKASQSTEKREARFLLSGDVGKLGGGGSAQTPDVRERLAASAAQLREDASGMRKMCSAARRMSAAWAELGVGGPVHREQMGTMLAALRRTAEMCGWLAMRAAALQETAQEQFVARSLGKVWATINCVGCVD